MALQTHIGNLSLRTQTLNLKPAIVVCFMLLATLLLSASHPATAQNSAAGSSTAELSPAADAETAAKVVRWSGTLPESAGKTIEIQFGIYENAAGGLALWTESQQVNVAKDGHYSVLLGATSNEGLPQTLFPAGAGRWVAAHPVANYKPEPETPRSLLAAVPYAFKSVDAETLAGRAASDYVTREDLKAASTALSFPTPPISGLGVQPAISGTGTTNYLPIWTNSTTFGNSLLYQNGSNVGIGLTSPSATLDVNGNTTVRGSLYLPPSGTATKTTGYGSHSQQFGASTWSSYTQAAVPQNFKLEALPINNNTATPSANFSLLYGIGTAAPTPTGFSIASNGLVTFASGQTFPGTGAITKIVTQSPILGGGTSGSVTISLSNSALETILNPVYAGLTTANNFTSSANFAGTLTGNATGSSSAIRGNTSNGIGVLGSASGAGFGVEGITSAATNNYAAVFGQNGAGSGMLSFIRGFADVSAGVWGDSAADSSAYYPIGVIGTADDMYAGYFLNNSTTYPTIYLDSHGGGAHTNGIFKTLMAVTPDGTCGFGSGGSLTCTGQIKSLISTHAGERNVETYSVQSPENWMEDFGKGEIQAGSGIVKLDPTFAETVSNSADYHVFLTPRGDSKGLYVTNLTATSFEVRESSGGNASIAFDYRIVAKRRGFEAQRMTDVTEQFKSEMKTSIARKHLGSDHQPVK